MTEIPPSLTAMRRPLRFVASGFSRWHEFWFTPLDPLALSIVRLGLGAVLLYSHAVYGLDLQNFVGATGWNNAGIVQGLQADTVAWSFWWLVPEGYEIVVHYACLGILALFCLGCWTRITSVLAWGITVSYAHRAMLSSFGLDQISAMLAFYLMLAPCGQYLSIDRWWRLRRSRRLHAADPAQQIESVSTASSTATLALRLIQFHLCVIYVWAGLSKLQGEVWWTGEAIWFVIANSEYQYWDFTWLAHYPLLLQVATHGVLLFELTFPVAMLYPRTRGLTLLIGILIHGGIAVTLGMSTFAAVMLVAYVAFADSEAIRRRMHWLVPAFATSLVGESTALAIRSSPVVGDTRKDGSSQEETEEVVPATKGVEQRVSQEPQGNKGQMQETLTSDATRREGSQYADTMDAKSDSKTAVNSNRDTASVRIAPGSLPKTRTSGRSERGVTDDLLYVARSKQHRATVREYFRRHGIFCSAVRGPMELIELTTNRRRATVVFRAKDYTHAELQFWIEELAATNPDGEFRVLILPQAKSTNQAAAPSWSVPEGVEVIPLSVTTTLRRIRHLYGNHHWGSSAPKPSSSTHRIARGFSWLLLMLLLVGCGAKSTSPKVQLERARLLLEQGQLHESVQAFTTALAKESGNAADYYDRGVAYEQLGQLEQAVGDYTEALRLDPQHAQALNNRGVVLARLGRRAEAQADLSKAVEVAPNDPVAWSNRGLARQEAGNHLDAISDYSQALFLQESARLFFQRGNAYADHQDFEAARKDFSKAIELDPSHVRAFVNRANVSVQLEQWDQAIADLRKAQDLDQELSMSGAISQIERRIRESKWRAVASDGLQAWLAEEGYEIHPSSAAQELSSFVLRRVGELHEFACVFAKTGPRGAPVFATDETEALVRHGKQIALFVIDHEALISATRQHHSDASSERPVWLKDWRFRWQPVASDFVPSQMEVLLGPAAD